MCCCPRDGDGDGDGGGGAGGSEEVLGEVNGEMVEYGK